jgi:hypothetical protein
MRIRVLAAAVALGAALATSVSAAAPAPYLRAAFSSQRHIVVVYTLGTDVAPGRVLVASSPKAGPNGKFLKADVRLSEPLNGTRTANGMRFRTRRALSPGRYWVEVSGVATGLDCTPHKPCETRWSNVRRVRVR